MTIPEACQLVLQAGALGRRRRDFRARHGRAGEDRRPGARPDPALGPGPERDIEIQFTGLRPGEKLFEELLLSNEGYDWTPHPKIVVGRIRADAERGAEEGARHAGGGGQLRGRGVRAPWPRAARARIEAHPPGGPDARDSCGAREPSRVAHVSANLVTGATVSAQAPVDLERRPRGHPRVDWVRVRLAHRLLERRERDAELAYGVDAPEVVARGERLELRDRERGAAG